MAKVNRTVMLKAANENLSGYAVIRYSSEWKEFTVKAEDGTYHTNSLIDALETACAIMAVAKAKAKAATR